MMQIAGQKVFRLLSALLAGSSRRLSLVSPGKERFPAAAGRSMSGVCSTCASSIGLLHHHLHRLLQAACCRSSSFGSKARRRLSLQCMGMSGILSLMSGFFLKHAGCVQVIFPALRLFLKPGRQLASDGSFVELTRLEKLYRIFERC